MAIEGGRRDTSQRLWSDGLDHVSADKRPLNTNRQLRNKFRLGIFQVCRADVHKRSDASMHCRCRALVPAGGLDLAAFSLAPVRTLTTEHIFCKICTEAECRRLVVRLKYCHSAASRRRTRPTLSRPRAVHASRAGSPVLTACSRQ